MTPSVVNHIAELHPALIIHFTICSAIFATQNVHDGTMCKRVGTFRVTYAVALASVGSFLIGYDTGVSAVFLPCYHSSATLATRWSGRRAQNPIAIAASSGCFLGCLLVGPITSRFGRRCAIVAAAMVFCLEATLQVTTYSLACFYAGRVVAGLRTGASSAIVPRKESQSGLRSAALDSRRHQHG